jgi:hypothetical protein
VSRRFRAGASVPLDPVYDERAIYTVAGEVEIAGDIFGPAQLLVFRPGDRITIRANTDARFMALGGEPMDGPRHIWCKSWGAEVFSEPHCSLPVTPTKKTSSRAARDWLPISVPGWNLNTAFKKVGIARDE